MTKHSYAFKKSRIIFYYVKAGNGITIEDKETLKKAIRNALRNNPKFEVVSDENIETVFKRNGISEDGCTTTECAVKIGKDASIAADYVMYGELYLSKEGLFLINVRVVNVESKSIFWEPSRIYRAESLSKFYPVCMSIVNEFAKIIPVEPQVKEVRSDGSLIIDVGSQLGMKKGVKYFVITKMQYGGPFDVEIDTLALAEIDRVTPELSLAKIVKKFGEPVVGAQLIQTAGEIDATPPVIQHESITSAGKNLDIPIQAEISDNRSVKRATLFFSTFPNGKFKKIPMTRKIGESNIYSASIPASDVGTADYIYYYLEAEDNFGNKRILKQISGDPFKIAIKSKDTTPPQITYNPPKEKAKTNEIIFSAKVVDDVRVNQVILYYRTKDTGPYSKIPLKIFAKDVYGVGIPIAKLNSSNLWYFLEAEDFSGNKEHIGDANAPIYLKISSKDVTAPKVKILRTLSRKSDGSFSVVASATDDNKVESVELIYAIYFEGEYPRKYKVPMHFVPKEGYVANIHLPTDKKIRVEYFVKATDLSGNSNPPQKNILILNTQTEASISEDSEPPVFLNYYLINFGLKTLNYAPGGNVVYPIIFKVKDNVGVDQVQVFYRDWGDTQPYKSLNMGEISRDDDYGILLLASDRGVQFYFKAIDSNNNVSFMGSKKDPFKIIPEKLGKLPSVLNKRTN